MISITNRPKAKPRHSRRKRITHQSYQYRLKCRRWCNICFARCITEKIYLLYFRSCEQRHQHMPSLMNHRLQNTEIFPYRRNIDNRKANRQKPIENKGIVIQ